uniref:Uncharacterized protein n=1 Tax=Cacopsylla melanoneura TaxID=428564 RepID=A0A8D8ZD05_9HEMI
MGCVFNYLYIDPTHPISSFLKEWRGIYFFIGFLTVNFLSIFLFSTNLVCKHREMPRNQDVKIIYSLLYKICQCDLSHWVVRACVCERVCYFTLFESSYP